MYTTALGKAMFRTLLKRSASAILPDSFGVMQDVPQLCLLACSSGSCISPTSGLGTNAANYCSVSACQDAPIKDAKQTGIILCGQPEMGEAVKKLVISQGIEEDAILTNF